MSNSQPEQCAFCDIVAGVAPAYIVYESETVVAFLDILPSTRGHILIVPKKHVALLSELPDELAREMGAALTLVSKALTKALDHEAFTVTLHQIYAQVVPHVHFHVVPAPDFRTSSSSHRSVYATRQELDEEDATILVSDIKARL